MIRRCLVLTVLLVATWMARVAIGAPPAASTAETLTKFPATIGAWSGSDSPLDAEVVKIAAVNDYLNRYYRSGNRELGLYIGYYRTQKQGEALHSPLFCLPGAGWQPTETSDFDLGVSGAPRRVKKLVVERGMDRLLVLYWYQTLTRVTGSEYLRKLFLMRDAFTSRRTDVALVRIIAPIDFRDAVSEARAVALARPFAEQVLPEVQQRLFRD
jgi:EpsI family protein